MEPSESEQNSQNSIAINSIYCSTCEKLFPNKKSHKRHKVSLIQIPTLLLDSYTFISILGKGTYGVVFKVLDKNDEEYKALKFMMLQDGNDDTDLKILKNLYHQNIIRYFGSQKKMDEGYIAILMELGDMDLHDFIEKKLFKNEEQKFQFVIQTASAINYLHNEVKPPVIHRDLKTKNILIAKETIRITDFGIARLKKSNSASDASLTINNIGSLPYMPPELLLEDLDHYLCNDKHDIWSLGIIIHQIFADNIHPFRYDSKWRKNMMDGKYRIHDSILKYSKICTIINGCLAFQPDKRMNVRNILDILMKENLYAGIEVKNDDSRKLHEEAELKDPKKFGVKAQHKAAEEEKKNDETMIVNFNLPQIIVDHFKLNINVIAALAPPVSMPKRTRTSGVSFKKLSKIITTVEDNEFLISALLPRKLSLLFRASEHKFRSLFFHEKCDNKGPTLTIIRTNQRIFGGYNADCWSEKYRNTSRMEDKAIAYYRYSSPNSFLFSLFHRRFIPLVDENDKCAIVYDAKFGPSFGYHDLLVSDDCNRNLQSESNLGSVYNMIGAGNLNNKEGAKYMAGETYFKVEEYEVYKVE